MDNYLDKNRFINLYRVQARGQADALRTTANDAARCYIKNMLFRDKFNKEIDQFIQEQLRSLDRARNERECKFVIDNLYQEKEFIKEQVYALKVKRAKVVVSAQLTNKLDTWGYFINGVGVIVGTGQIVAGAGIAVTSLLTGNVIGIIAGATIVLHGANNVYESFQNLKTNRDDTEGFLRSGYVKTAEFLGFSAATGRVAYSMSDISLSGYGLARMVIKPDAWRLYRYLPSDFIRNIKTIGAPSLALETLGDTITLKSIYDQR